MLEVDVEGRVGSFSITARFTSGPGVTALFGRSGAGKSSLINMVAGLLRPERGRIAVGDTVLFDASRGINVAPSRRRIGYVFQEGRLFPHLTVRRNLRYGRWFTRRDDRFVSEDHVVDLLGIGHLLKRRPGDLSGGEKQRVAIGRTLLASPRLLLMDEPLAALDVQRKAEILPYIERLRDDMRIPIVYVSHAMEEVARLADTLVLMSAGRVAASGPLEEILGRLDLRPLTGRYEAGTVIETQVARHRPEVALSVLEFRGGELSVPAVDLPVGHPIRVRVRSRDVAIALDRPAGLSIRNVIAARIEEVSREEGAFAEVRLSAGDAVLIARLTRDAVETLDLRPGLPVFALVKSIALDRHSLGLASTRPRDTVGDGTEDGVDRN